MVGKTLGEVEAEELHDMKAATLSKVIAKAFADTN